MDISNPKIFYPELLNAILYQTTILFAEFLALKDLKHGLFIGCRSSCTNYHGHIVWQYVFVVAEDLWREGGVHGVQHGWVQVNVNKFKSDHVNWKIAVQIKVGFFECEHIFWIWTSQYMHWWTKIRIQRFPYPLQYGNRVLAFTIQPFIILWFCIIFCLKF